MLRLMFVLASLLAVLGGMTAGSPLQRVAAGLVAVTLLGHRALVQRQLSHRGSVREPVAGPAGSAVSLGRLDR
jgi:hypothetical protein